MANQETQGEARVFSCPHCEAPATGHVRGTAEWSGRALDGTSVNPPVEWALVQCGRCEQVCVQVREDYGRGFADDEPLTVFPAPRRLSPSVPFELQREWNEARACLEAKAYTACVVMVRRTLEGTCADQGIKKRNLAAGLTELSKRGLMDGTLSEWADALRVLGNQGAHFTGKPVAREDAEDSLDFAEALLDHLYVLRKRFEEFRARVDRPSSAPGEG